MESLQKVLDVLENHLAEGREYLADDAFSLADVACASNFVRLREGTADLGDSPGVDAWIKCIEARKSYGASV